MFVRNPKIALLLLFLLPAVASAQLASTADSLSVPVKEIPKVMLWQDYRFQFEASGGTEPYHWRILYGSLPHSFELSDQGEITGRLNELEAGEFIVQVWDSSNPRKQHQQPFELSPEIPLKVDWLHKAQVEGQRIQGSVKVSNQTWRDFDLTFVVLAVNGIGRATAIGYQHFSLPKNTREMELPFGETLSPGNYVVNVDVVAEEPISNRIFRARLATGQESVTQGP